MASIAGLPVGSVSFGSLAAGPSFGLAGVGSSPEPSAGVNSFSAGAPSAGSSAGLAAGFCASTFVLARNANAFSNLLEYPVWLATGLLVPLTLLPAWVEPISWVLAPTWGIRAIRDAALGGGGSAWPEIAMCVLLGAVYLALGSVLLENFERLARQRATLSLA